MTADEWTGEFRIEHGTQFYAVDSVGYVAKKVGDEWVTLVPGWCVEEGWGGNAPVTIVEYDPDAAAFALSLN